jgi:cytochrome P450
VTHGLQTHGTLVIFVYLLMNHPEVQHRARAEIDRVVGRQRLPDFEDRASLPYVDAVLRETMRWHPVFCMGAFDFNAEFLDPLTWSRWSPCHH